MSTISLSAWPMPELSTMIRSKPAAWQTAIESSMFLVRARWAWRVASERMKTRSEPRTFSRMRSPRRAPPVFLLVGSIERMATVRSASSARKRRTISSVSEDLPAPPVPVMPRTGAGLSRFGVSTSMSSSTRVMARATASQRSCGVAEGAGGVHLCGVEVGALDHRVDHAVETHGAAVFGGEDLGHAVGFELFDLARHDHPAAAAVDLDVLGAAFFQEIDHVLEELDVAALVGGDRDALGVLLDGGVDDFLDRAVVAEVDDLCAVRLQDAAHDVDGRVVAVEQRRRGHETDLVVCLVGFGFGQMASRGGFTKMIAGAPLAARLGVLSS